MSPVSWELPGILMATLSLSISALLAYSAVYLLKPKSPGVHRLIWIAVLLNGIILSRFAVNLPVLEQINQSNRLFVTDQNSTSEASVNWRNHRESTQEFATRTAPQKTEEHASNQLGGFDDGSLASESFQSVTANVFSTINVVRRFVFEHCASVLMIIWIAGILYIASVWLVRYLSLIRHVRECSIAPKLWQNQVRQVSDEMGIHSELILVCSTNLGPCLVLTPGGYRLVVPTTFWANLTSVQRTAILRHEMSHYQRSDIWTSLFVAVMALPHWFNPLSWMAVRRFNEAAEWACDQAIANPSESAGFARALLSLSTSDPAFLAGANNMAASDLNIRVKRLLLPRRDSMFRQFIICALSVFIAALGWINLRLVSSAKATIATNPWSEFQEDQEQQIRDLATSLGELPELVEFRKILKTQAGKIAVSNRVEGLRQEVLRSQADRATEEFFAQFTNPNKLEEFQFRMMESVKAADKDIAILNTALTELKSKMSGSSEADQMMQRFLGNKNAAQILYFSELRNQMRPSKQLIAERMREVFADNGRGQYIVRESAKDRLRKKIKDVEKLDEVYGLVKTELAQWGEELSDQDELHKKVKAGFADPLFAARIVAELMESSERSLTARMEMFFNQLDHAFVDTTSGLEIHPDVEEDFRERIRNIEVAAKRIKATQSAINEFVRSIDQSAGELEKSVAKFFDSPVGAAAIIDRLELRFDSVDGIVQEISNEVLEDNGNGKFKVRDDRQEEMVEFSRNMLQNGRRIRRHARIASTHVEKLGKELQSLMTSQNAKLVLVDRVKQFVMSQRVDAWKLWLEQNFEQTDDGLVPTSDASEMIADLIKESKEIEAQLNNDDF